MIKIVLLSALLVGNTFAETSAGTSVETSAIQSVWQRIKSMCHKDTKATPAPKIPSHIKIAVVSMKDVASKCKAGTGINEQLQKINDAAKARLLPLEEQVKKESERLKEDAIRAEEMQAALYDTVKTERYQISDAADIAIEKLKKVMKEVIEKVASRDGIIIFDSDAVLSRDNVVDITDLIVLELDKECPYIEVKLEK